MKCRFIRCENTPGNHDYGEPYNNACKECLEIYFEYEKKLKNEN